MKKLVAIVTVLIVLCGFSAVAGAATTTPGSENDPVVTKSYVDAQIKANAGAAKSYEAVFVNMGKKVLGGNGTEIILRSGEAKSLAKGSNGIADLTDGKDLMGNQGIVQNHLLLVPRNDGRGIVATTDIWIMVKGSYTIQ
ncbi:MAG: hypothetical protein RR131_02500 [Anaerovorax sp.]